MQQKIEHWPKTPSAGQCTNPALNSLELIISYQPIVIWKKIYSISKYIFKYDNCKQT